MKQDLMVTGSVELNSSEVLEALLKRNLTREEVSKAVHEYLNKQGFLSKKIVYSDKNDITKGIVVTVEKMIQDGKIKKYPDIKPKREKDQPGFKKRNIGIFDTISELIEDFRKKGMKQIAFDDFYKDIVYFYPGLTKKNFNIYIHDKRRFPNVRYESKMVYL